jgi:hypothetical protein
MTPIQALQKAADLGLKLGSEHGDTLTYQPAGRCPLDFAETLKANKCYLLVLLRLPFVMAYSKTLGQTVFFAADEDTKAVLIEAGANPSSVYTRDELKLLVEARQFLSAELKGSEKHATMFFPEPVSVLASRGPPIPRSPRARAYGIQKFQAWGLKPPPP